MTYRLHRYYGNGDLHFITCSCHVRRPWLGSARRRDLFLKLFEETRQNYRFVVVGYVIMPEHMHLLISEPEQGMPSTVMQVVKQRFAHQVLKEMRRRRERINLAYGRNRSMCGNGDFTISMYGVRRSGWRSCVICIAIQ